MTTLRKGSRGSEVKTLQTLLGNVKVDGIFGNDTLASVKAFQRAHNLTADGIVGKMTWAVLKGGTDPKDVVIKCEDLKQFSSPHGNMVYGPNSNYSTYRYGGCGVVSFAIVQRALNLAPDSESSTQTIQRLGRYSWEHGYRIKDNGTSAGLFNTNGTKYESTTSASKLEYALREGKLLILHIKEGFPNGYGGKGHYIVAYGISGENVLLRDCGSSAASRQTAPLAKITKGLKHGYIITKR